MKTLKVKSILFSLLAIIAVAVFMTSCEQTGLTTIEEAVQHPTPVQYIVDDNPTDFSDYQVDLNLSDIINNGTVTNRGNCPAYEHAHNQLSMLLKSCEYPKGYCEYLKLFWRIHAVNALVNCDAETFCGFCEWAINQAYEDLERLQSIGIHDSYISNILEQIQILENTCSEC